MSTGAENDPYNFPSVPTYRDFTLPVDDPFNQTLGDQWFDLQKDKVSTEMAQLAVNNVPQQPAHNIPAAESRPPLAQHNAPERSNNTSNGPTAKPARRYTATRQAQSLAAKRRSASVNPPAPANADAVRVSLEWDPPTKDGGAPIEEYIIEMKDPHSKDWVQVATSKTPKATVTGLKEGQEYQFRVKAKDKAGPGQPSEPHDRVVAEPKFDANSSLALITPDVVNDLANWFSGL